MSQNVTKWVNAHKEFIKFEINKAAPGHGTLLNRIDKQTSTIPQLNPDKKKSVVGNCYAAHPLFRERGIASICTKNEIYQTIAKDFSTTGKCNFYFIEDFLHLLVNSMALQVGLTCSLKNNFFVCPHRRKEVRFWKISTSSWILANRWG